MGAQLALDSRAKLVMKAISILEPRMFYGTGIMGKAGPGFQGQAGMKNVSG